MYTHVQTHPNVYNVLQNTLIFLFGKISKYGGLDHGLGPWSTGRTIAGHERGAGELEPAQGRPPPGPVVRAAHQLVECPGTAIGVVEQDHQVWERPQVFHRGANGAKAANPEDHLNLRNLRRN